METTWLIDMHNKPKLPRYITFKTTLFVSSDVKQYISKPRRKLLIQLITGILPIGHTNLFNCFTDFFQHWSYRVAAKKKKKIR